MKEYVSLANFLTSGSLVAGFLSVLLVFRDNLAAAAALIVFAAILDLLDGAAARRAGNENAFGTNLDSLADVVSFGAAPALALYMGSLYALPLIGLAGCILFFLCGAWRLARSRHARTPFTSSAAPYRARACW
jgi:CDP-diacylglycerol--serine O-phosphatidyltransferase